MSEFQFVCPFCDTLLDCPEDMDGVEAECPVCNKIIVPVSADAKKYNNNLIQKEIVIQDRKSLKEKIFNTVKKINVNSPLGLFIVIILFFLVPFGVTSCILSCAISLGEKNRLSTINTSQQHSSSNRISSKQEVISRSKELLFTAISNKISYSDRNEISNSFFVNACVVDSDSGVVHATFKLRNVEHAYSVEFKIENGSLTPTQIYCDNGITPEYYWKK